LANRTTAGINPAAAAWFRVKDGAVRSVGETRGAHYLLVVTPRRKIGLEIGHQGEAHCPHGSDLKRRGHDLRRRAMT